MRRFVLLLLPRLMVTAVQAVDEVRSERVEVICRFDSDIEFVEKAS